MAKIFCLLLLIISSFLPEKISANSDILINEFYALGNSSANPDWVEIYNSSNIEINLEGWKIRDLTTSNKITLEGYICANNFRIFDFSNRLNKGGDKIKLINSQSIIIDEIDYFSSEIPSHGKNQSTGRDSSSSDTWMLLTVPTPTNDDACTPEPTPTIETEDFSNKSIQFEPYQSLSPSPLKSPNSKPSISKQPKSVLGETNFASPKLLSLVPSSSPSANIIGDEKNTPSISKPRIFMGVGSILVGVSIAFYIWYYRIKGKTNLNKDQKIDFKSKDE